jgi:hypothetical protein
MSEIYVASGVDGLVKIGSTKDFSRRLPALKQAFKRIGNQLVEYKTFGPLTDDEASFAERFALNHVRPIFSLYHGREWFLGSFEFAVGAADMAIAQVPLRPIFHIQPESDEDRAARLLMRDRRRAEAERRLADHKRGVEERKALRELRKRQIAERVLAATGA